MKLAEHGTVRRYNQGDRCQLCKDAIAKYRRDHYVPKMRAEQMNGKYRTARDAGYSSVEARRRAHWADPLRP